MLNSEKANFRPENGVLACDDYYGAYMLDEQIRDHQEASEEQRVMICRGHNHIDNNYGSFGRFAEQASIAGNQEILNNWDEIINSHFFQ